MMKFGFSMAEKHKNEFLDLFYKPVIENHPLTLKTKVSLFVMRIDGSSFDYIEMKRVLGNASISYALARNQIRKELQHEDFKRVAALFRDHEINDGEGGELFLYCFLETHLGAPKILSKMELKTAGNDYIKGADGIHILDLGNGNYHLIFGESKMISDSSKKDSSLTNALTQAFESIKKVKEEGIGGEISLVDSNLMKESVDENELDFLKRIIKPSARDEGITKNNAFGIFVGFEIDITDWDLQNIKDVEFNNKIKESVRESFEKRYTHIQNKILEFDLDGHHFYIYAIPFIKKGKLEGIDNKRKDIIKHIQ